MDKQQLSVTADWLWNAPEMEEMTLLEARTRARREAKRVGRQATVYGLEERNCDGADVMVLTALFSVSVCGKFIEEYCR